MDAERRQVTVLFTDMVGFTSFSERSGEEAAFTLMRSLSKLMDDAVHEHGGVVQSFTGDGIMAVFGAPVAFEDAPLRACRAALGILDRLKAAAPELDAKHGVRPQLRIGLNTGAAVVGRVQQAADAGITVLGDAVNFAARLQALAEPDSVFMSEATHRLVQGLVDESFAGEQIIKGKSEPQKVYRLNGVRKRTSRFEAAVGRGLSAFVGREHEREVLERALDNSREGLRVVDIVAEPGMGKSRLLHEFRQQIGKDRAFILAGSCSPDGQQTPFLPFIEVVRCAFRLSAGEPEKDVAQKLQTGLSVLGLQSNRNLGLLLHLIGLKPPDDALTGLDGVLIGLRTRELLQALLQARCRLYPVVMVIEDLHWTDSVSEELLGKIARGESTLRLLIITTHRPERCPSWLDHSSVTNLPLEPLRAGDIRHLIQERLSVAELPEGLAQQVIGRAEGNPLFAEEIVSYLVERGDVRTASGALEFNASTISAALPMSVQSLLTARIDRLPPNDRALLQAASVIGRRFDSEILAAVINETDVDARLNEMQMLGLVHAEAKSSDYSFKHALVRDALYNSLLSEARVASHLKIAEQIERKSSNRLIEVAEVLAHHYRQTANAEKAFIYLSMAGSKSLNVYSLEEASNHFTEALALLDSNPECATDEQVADFLLSYTRLLHFMAQIKKLLRVHELHGSRLLQLGDDQRVVIVRSNLVIGLLLNARYRDAADIQPNVSLMAQRLGDSTSLAYAYFAELSLSTVIAPKPVSQFLSFKELAVQTAVATDDSYILSWMWWSIGFDEAQRGLMNQARNSAQEIMRVGKSLNDPRCTGVGLWVLTWIALGSDSYAEALSYSEQSFATAVTPLDRIIAMGAMGNALVTLRRLEEAIPILDQQRRCCIDNGFLYNVLGSDPFVALSKIFRGDISAGISFLEEAILRREVEGYLATADWYRGILAEVYLQIIARSERLPILALLKNLPIILKITFVGPSRVRALTSTRP